MLVRALQPTHKVVEATLHETVSLVSFNTAYHSDASSDDFLIRPKTKAPKTFPFRCRHSKPLEPYTIQSELLLQSIFCDLPTTSNIYICLDVTIEKIVETFYRYKSQSKSSHLPERHSQGRHQAQDSHLLHISRRCNQFASGSHWCLVWCVGLSLSSCARACVGACVRG